MNCKGQTSVDFYCLDNSFICSLIDKGNALLSVWAHDRRDQFKGVE